MKVEYFTNEEKLEAIQDIVNDLYSRINDEYEVYSKLMLIKSICDIPLIKDTWND